MDNLTATSGLTSLSVNSSNREASQSVRGNPAGKLNDDDDDDDGNVGKVDDLDNVDDDDGVASMVAEDDAVVLGEDDDVDVEDDVEDDDTLLDSIFCSSSSVEIGSSSMSTFAAFS